MKVEGGKETFGFRRILNDPAAVIFSGFPKSASPGSVKTPPSWFTSYCRFFFAGLTRHAQTGAIIPSQRFLIDQMIAPIPLAYNGQIVELGAGTGALTCRLAARRPQCQMLSCEINPALARGGQARMATTGFQKP